MKNYLHFSSHERAQALLILEGHFHADLIGTPRGEIQLYLSVWDANLGDSLDIRIHESQVSEFSHQFTAQFGHQCHEGNFLAIVEDFFQREAPHKCIVEEVGHLYRAGLIESLSPFYSDQL